LVKATILIGGGFLKVPESVKNKLSPEVVKAVKSSKKSSSIGGDYVKKLELGSHDFKDRTRKILWEVYRSEGYSKFIDVVGNLKVLKNHEFNDLIQVKGETAEVVLEIIIEHFIKHYALDWKVVKGLILNINGNVGSKSSTTEIDIVLVTSKVVSIFEIKSFNGEKVISGDCLLTANNAGNILSKDVFLQNRLHIKAFWNNFGKFSLSETGIVKSVMFSFSSGSLKDDRSIDKKEIMPVYDESNIPRYLEAIRLLDVSDRWKVDELNEAIEVAEKGSVSLEDHIKYLSGKHDSLGK
jgi:hypothetical protein